MEIHTNNRHILTIFNKLLTALGVRRAPLYRWVALLESAKTRRPPEPRSRQGPGFAAACTEKQMFENGNVWSGEWEGRKKTKTSLRRNLREIWIRNIRNLRYHRASMSWVSHHIQMGSKFHVFTQKCGVRVLLLPLCAPQLVIWLS